jgi:hypothetical protein
VLLGEWRIGLELRVHEQGTEEEERSAARVDQHRILPEPPQAREPREVALEDRAGVDIRPARDPRPALRLQPFEELPQSLLEDAVVVAAARVARQRSCRLEPAVIEGDHDRRPCAALREPGVASQGRVARQPCHLAGLSPRQPLLERLEGSGRTESGDAGEVEA